MLVATMMRTFVALSLTCTAHGFVTPHNGARFPGRTIVMFESSSSTMEELASSDFGSAMPEQVTPYEKIGIAEEQLALGINPEDVISYIGTREDMIDRTMQDIPSLDRAQAEAEVDKFLLDAECLRIYIEFNKRKAEDPDFALESKEEEEGAFSFRNFVFVYLAYVAYTSVPPMFRRWVEGKEAAGEWNGSGIKFIDDWLENGAPADVPPVDIPVDVPVSVDVAEIAQQASTMVDTLSDVASAAGIN